MSLTHDRDYARDADVYTLSVSEDYCAHWGFWEAVREIIQNAFDARDSIDDCTATIENRNGDLVVSTSKGMIEPRHLLLGQTSKSLRDRGSYGEGLKIAMLVLARLKYDVEVQNGNLRWKPEIAPSPRYGCNVLQIEQTPMTGSTDGVTFVIRGAWERWEKHSDKVYEGAYGVLDTLGGPLGRIFVGGLWVCDMPEFHHSYHFEPHEVALDRDRGTVDGFDLKVKTSALWKKLLGPELYKLLEARAPDVEYLHPDNAATANVVESFQARHGDAIPVSSQADVARATEAGAPFALVPNKIREIVGKVRSLFIPSQESPLARLEGFLDRYRWRLDTEMKCELDDVVRVMREQREKLMQATEEDAG